VIDFSRNPQPVAGCFIDHRDPTRVTHPVAALVRQSVYGLALGYYEDLTDYDALRHDPLIAARGIG
jgi:Transposase DDE domain group 1